MAKTLLFLTYTLSVIPLFGQSKWREHHTQHSTEYYQQVQSVRHGQCYLVSNWFLTSILSFGTYVRNERHGDWYFFYADGLNSLHSRGTFVSGKRQGRWISYFPPIQSNPSVAQTLGMQARTAIIEDKNMPDQKFLAYDTTGQQLMSIGKYFNGLKTGIWNYYDRRGELYQQFDHSQNKLILDFTPDSLSRRCSFLGGESRLLFMLSQLQTGEKVKIFPKSGKVIVRVEKVEGAIRFTPTEAANEKFQAYAIDLISSLPDDWIVNPEATRNLFVSFEVVVDRGAQYFRIDFPK